MWVYAALKAQELENQGGGGDEEEEEEELQWSWDLVPLMIFDTTIRHSRSHDQD